MTSRKETTKGRETRRERNNHISPFCPAAQMHRRQIRAEIVRDQTNCGAGQKVHHHQCSQGNHRGSVFLLGSSSGNGLTRVAGEDGIL